MSSYIKPVIIIDDPNAENTKPRLIDIFKNEVFKDIDLHTYKYVEGSGVQDVRVGNAVAADGTERMDSAVMARLVEFRDAQLRKKLQRFLMPVEAVHATDKMTINENVYRYYFNAPESFSDNTLRALAEYIHRFLVWGALYDWYAQFGMPQASVYAGQLDTIEKAIDGLVRGSSLVKRPLQPFGPAKKMY